MKPPVTGHILQDADPARWAEHRFGLSVGRWAALRQRCLWVTGAGSGFGRAIAVALAAAGARVVLSGRREAALKDSLAEMDSLGISSRQCRAVPLDVTDESQVAAACRQVHSDCGNVYGLVHCAALPTEPGRERPLLEGSHGYWQVLLATNVTGPWLLTRSAFPLMRAGGQARVVLLSSGAGWAFTSGFGPYNVSKAAVNCLGGSLAAEMAAAAPEMDIQCNVLDPGQARTQMNRSSPASPYSVVSMTMMLLSHPGGGPNGMFFHRDGRHLEFASSGVYPRSLSEVR
ncbi:MAG: SDR family oxidoreductase [Planctomycetaceae bacterium]|nr:SDR family oxidoreductase [Planctomycetaceae bacterium]